eukprot:COSAG02_NODE_5495_length_4282_cov_2.570165_4_plen_75_part_00
MGVTNIAIVNNYLCILQLDRIFTNSALRLVLAPQLAWVNVSRSRRVIKLQAFMSRRDASACNGYISLRSAITSP